jgi:uncharacterized protein (DUF433 family)
MKTLDRITRNPLVMGGKPCIREMRITVGTIAGLVASGRSREDILKLYSYASWLSEAFDAELQMA